MMGRLWRESNMVDRYNIYGQRLDDHDPLRLAYFVRSSDYDTLAAELAAMTNDQKAILALTAEIERLHQRNEELRSANGYAELEARLAEAETQNRVMWDVANDREARLAEAMRPKEVIIKGDRYQIEPREDGTVNVRWLGVADSASVEGEK